MQGHEKVYGQNNELTEKLSRDIEILRRERERNGNSRTEKYKI